MSDSLITRPSLLVRIRDVKATTNLFDSGYAFYGEVVPGDTETNLPKMVGWEGKQNLFGPTGPSVNLVTKGQSKSLNGLVEWRKFWGTAEADSIQGRVRYQGSDLRARLLVAKPEKITPDDFRLRPDSAGYRAGKDGKDLGADIDLVGPGPAYERWKKTPEYQKWLKETGQKPHATASPEPKPFVLLGAKGVEIRQLDTLAEAVQAASDGDTIEVRGNGPFVTEPITIRRALTIRAGQGFRPVIIAPDGRSC